MSGRGRGYCTLKLPSITGEPVTGLAGRPGWPVVAREARRADRDELLERMRHLNAALADLRRRVDALNDAAGRT